MNALHDALSPLALSVPGMLLGAGLLPDQRRPAVAVTAAAAGLATAIAALVAFLPADALTGAGLAVRLDVVTAVMLVLVTGLGLVVTRYARTYLEGDPGRSRAERWLLLTLGAVTLLVVTRDLLVLALAWTATSIALHQLLTFYPDRTAALVAAHKKFIISRFADVFLWSAIALVAFTVGSTDLDALANFVSAQPSLPVALEAAALCFVLAAAMKSAQLPFHGWLTQVMEAPTPISALLHAGVVNIGGFVMIRLVPLMSAAPAAQALLVVIGLCTAALAGLVMTTRVSIKVALAWSTIAQMGFMLMQCGLGAWHLALLHLVAHSLYKAHAFLSAGSVVEAWSQRASAPHAAATPRTVAIAVGLSALTVAPFLLLGGHAVEAPLAVLLALGLVSLHARGTSLPLVLAGACIAALSFGAHAAAAQVLSVPAAPQGWWWVAVAGLGAVFLVQLSLQLAPRSAFARALHPWLFSGFFLDEHFTRLTFLLWPPRLVAPARRTGLTVTTSVEA